jgi:hypothetical protein
VARHFHLGFKGMEEEEVYNVLMEQLIATINKYDPFYTEKVKRVVEVIEHELRARKKQFSAADLNRYLDFDTHRHLRMLCRRGYLSGFRRKRSPSKIRPGGLPA